MRTTRREKNPRDNPARMQPDAHTTAAGDERDGEDALRSPQSAGRPEEKRRDIFDRRAVLLSMGLVLIVLAALANRFQNAFHFVDFHAVTARTPIQDPHNVRDSPVARDEYEKSVEPKAAQGPSPAALTRHAAELCQDRKYQECLEEAQKAIEIRPDYAEAYNNKAYALIAMNRLDEAIRDFQEAVRLKPDYTTAKENLARALEQKRREEQPGHGPAEPR